MVRFVTLTVLGALLAAVSLGADAPPAPLDARRKALNDLLAEQWEYTLSTNPEFASIIGDKRWNDKSSDTSLAAIEKDLAKSAAFLKRFEAIDTSGFPEQEQLNKTLMVRQLEEGLEGAKFKGWEMPVTQISGLHIQAPQFVNYLAFDTTKDYDDYLTRLKNLPKQLDDTMDHMRRGMADGLMPPKFLLEKVVPQAETIAKADPEKSPFALCLSKFPKTVSPEDQKRIHDALVATIRDSIEPEYVKFAKFVKDDYAPKGRTEVGLWSLPDGAARYAFRVKESTTTDMTPEEIHQLGLREVARIEGEMEKIAKKMGYADRKAFDAAIEKDPKLHAHSRQEIVDLYSKYITAMWAKLPQMFGRLPKAKVEVKPTEAFREKDAAGAEYNTGTPDGSRPGVVNVNTGDFEKRKIINIETTAYHEGVPGHHMQLSIAQELPTIPPFRQQGGNTAYVEGWALYAEDLGRDAGFFQDPYQLYGHYQDEMLRAIRLVVDTGLHYKKWTRPQVVDFFHAHSGSDEVEVQSETDRYISWPAQALGYKIGQLTILALREKAKKELGEKFDIRKFHDEVLGAGALPMDVLQTRIDAWIAAQKAA
ncbi:MAG TPA: DUF885 family protein [Thermoanaerobaculia bacterium]|nr:DUF885 family protein [Thermoanaerobaculia bacterium]